MTTATKKTDCFGAKRCPKAPNNTARVWCPHYDSCLNELIHKELVRRRSPMRIARYLRGFLHDSDFMILWRVGRVASVNGFLFGRKRIDSTIQASTICEDGESEGFEAREIRKAFGVFGRAGAHRARSVPRERTEPQEHPALSEESTEGDILHPSGGFDAGTTKDGGVVRHYGPSPEAVLRGD